MEKILYNLKLYGANELYPVFYKRFSGLPENKRFIKTITTLSREHNINSLDLREYRTLYNKLDGFRLTKYKKEMSDKMRKFLFDEKGSLYKNEMKKNWKDFSEFLEEERKNGDKTNISFLITEFCLNKRINEADLKTFARFYIFNNTENDADESWRKIEEGDRSVATIESNRKIAMLNYYKNTIPKFKKTAKMLKKQKELEKWYEDFCKKEEDSFIKTAVEALF